MTRLAPFLALAVVLVVSACASEPASRVAIAHRAAATTCVASAGDSFGPDQCAIDSDCQGGTSVCSCAGTTFEWSHQTRNICVAANCRVDTDCNTGACSPSLGDTGPFYGVQGYYCRTAQDECRADSECTANGAGYCMFAAQVAHWVCAYNFAAG